MPTSKSKAVLKSICKCMCRMKCRSQCNVPHVMGIAHCMMSYGNSLKGEFNPVRDTTVGASV